MRESRGFTVKIPKDIAISVTLEQGSIYLFPEESFNTTVPHFFIVLNKNPIENPFLILTCATSQVTKRLEWVKKRGLSPETIVALDKNNYKFLSKDTVVDCNHIVQKTKEVLMEKYENGTLKLKGQLADKDLANVIEGVRKSKLISRIHKNLL